MPVLGYGQVSSIAPNLISKGYEGIVRNLQQTGQEIAANVQRVQTNKQVQALGQEMATIDPYSPTFPQQMLAVATKYPMALADQRGQALMGVLGIAHKDYLNEQMKQRDFNRDVALEGYQHRYRLSENAEKPGKRSLYSTPGGLYDPAFNETGGIIPGTEPREKPVVPPRPIVVGGQAFDPITREPIPGMVAPQKQPAGANRELTTYQLYSLKLKQLDDEIDNLTTDLRNEDEEGRKLDIQKRLDEKRILRDKLEISTAPLQAPSAPGLGGLNPIEAVPVPTPLPVPVPMVPEASVLPAPGAIPATPKNSGPSWRKYLP